MQIPEARCSCRSGGFGIVERAFRVRAARYERSAEALSSAKTLPGWENSYFRDCMAGEN